MALSFGSLLWAIVLLTNAVAILNERRFLAPLGLGGATAYGYGGAGEPGSVKRQTVQLLSAVRTLLRIPLVIINTILIVYELILG